MARPQRPDTVTASAIHPGGVGSCQSCGEPILYAWFGRTLRAVDAAEVDGDLLDARYKRHVCFGPADAGLLSAPTTDGGAK